MLVSAYYWTDRTVLGVWHYNDVIMDAMTSQITSPTVVYSPAYSGTDQRKYKSPASLAFVRGIHRWPVNSLHKWPVTRKMFPFDDVIMRRQDAYVRSHFNAIVKMNYTLLSCQLLSLKISYGFSTQASDWTLGVLANDSNVKQLGFYHGVFFMTFRLHDTVRSLRNPETTYFAIGKKCITKWFVNKFITHTHICIYIYNINMNIKRHITQHTPLSHDLTINMANDS